MKLSNISIYNEDNLKTFKRIPDGSIDVILTDPPYLYLKNQKLDRPFAEQKFFEECKRVLSENGSLLYFGRGVSIARWMVICDNLHFNFKEEIVWDKRCVTSPVLKLQRKHEMCMIFQKGKGTINRVKIDFFEKHKYDPIKVQRVAERLATTFGNRKTFNLLKKYYETGYKEYMRATESTFHVTRGKNSAQNRTLAFAQGLEEGINESDIISQMRDHYNTIHPTQKPVRLLERLLALVIPKEKPKDEIVVFDPFGGSFSTMEAVHNMGLRGISCEIDAEYFEAGKKRIEALQPTLF